MLDGISQAVARNLTLVSRRLSGRKVIADAALSLILLLLWNVCVLEGESASLARNR